MYCIHCGTQLREEARFCTQCGKPVVRQERNGRSGPDFSKVSINQILSALNSVDIKAPAQAGEIRCSCDSAQTAFMRLLRKGLLVLMAFIAFHAEAHTVFRGIQLTNGKTDPEKGITVTATGYDLYPASYKNGEVSS